MSTLSALKLLKHLLNEFSRVYTQPTDNFAICNFSPVFGMAFHFTYFEDEMFNMVYYLTSLQVGKKVDLLVGLWQIHLVGETPGQL
jgi:hypothetical protein